MTDKTHYQSFVDYVVGDDNSELGRVKAERDYALFSLEREIAICAETQRRMDFMEAKYGKIDWDAGRAVGIPLATEGGK